MLQGNPDSAKPEDLALATLQMVSMNIGMLAHLHAEANGATCTLFAGNFLQRNPFARRTLVQERHDPQCFASLCVNIVHQPALISFASKL